MWHYPATFPTLAHDEVHIWRVVATDISTFHIQSLKKVLTAQERNQAERFRLLLHATRFIVAHGTLRIILGHYLGQDASTLQFHYGPYGKPAFAADTTLHFNVTHARDTALFAITQHREVGVDLEYINDDMDYEQIAAQNFTRNEVHALRAIPSNALRCQAFFRVWTRKEAFLKARGLGIAHDLATTDVPVIAATPTALSGTKAGSSTVFRWWLHDLPSTEDSVATLAVESSPCSLKYWQWSSQ